MPVNIPSNISNCKKFEGNNNDKKDFFEVEHSCELKISSKYKSHTQYSNSKYGCLAQTSSDSNNNNRLKESVLENGKYNFFSILTIIIFKKKDPLISSIKENSELTELKSKINYFEEEDY